MAIPARVRRRITVDDTRFDWCSSRSGGGLSLYIEGPRGQVRVAIVDASAEDDAGDHLHRPVTPRLVVRIIRWACDGGWSPQEPGLQELCYADGWGVPEPLPPLDEREVITLGDATRLEAVVAYPLLPEGADTELVADIDRSGLLGRPPYAKGALDLRLDKLTDAERELVIRAWYAQQLAQLHAAGQARHDPSAIREHASSLGGGLALWDDSGELRIMPQCCCTLASIISWRDATRWREPEAGELWTGHPWCSVRYRAPYLWIDTNMRGRPLAIHPRRLRRLLQVCRDAFASLRAQAAQVLAREGLPHETVLAYAEVCAGHLDQLAPETATNHAPRTPQVTAKS